MNIKRFENKTVIVTGGSRGIGKAIALEFGKGGANVVINFFKEKMQPRKSQVKLNHREGTL